MPDVDESTYHAWIGRKQSTIRRAVLDCGHPKTGDVHYHIWCDRLSCSNECAEAEHDCGEFKGSKTSIEEEAVEPEAAPTEPPLVLRRPPAGAREVAASTPMDPVIQEAFRREVRRQGFTWYQVDDVTYSADDPVRTWFDETHTFERAYLNERVEALRPFLTTALDAEVDAFAERASAALDELRRTILGRMESLAPIEPGDMLEIDGGRYVTVAVHGDGRVDIEPVAPLVDAALQPDPDVPLATGGIVERVGWTIVGEQGCDLTIPPTAPWWRRYLPGGTR